MATLSSSSPHLILHRFILRRPTLQFSSLISHTRQFFPPPLKTTPYFTSRPFSSTRSLFISPRSCLSQQLADDVALLENVQIESEIETITTSNTTVTDGLKNLNSSGIKTAPPSLTAKEKKDLASYAHSLGEKLKSQQVGKSGVTDTVIMALSETLEKRELLKLKIHGTCPGEMEDVVKQVQEGTGSVVVGQIGRTVILYRPSLTKQKAEEKKKQAQRIFLSRQSKSKLLSQSKRPVPVAGQEPREFGRGRRGRSRI
ncbi:hypothetical protein ACJIZ3_000817 [Penstemon smallii]|uniref:CRM domain-containing protein n=1 Tax=Penstemon smallii TaxID=265156 RepID=A0ABD3U1T5_9LAMI